MMIKVVVIANLFNAYYVPGMVLNTSHIPL